MGKWLENMTEELTIGSAPCEEDCVQVGEEDYQERAGEECERFITLIRKCLGPEPAGARLVIRGSYHDFGRYLEVVCRFDRAVEAACDYAYKCEAEAPARWSDGCDA